MPEGLKLVIGGDVKEAEQALKSFVGDLGNAGAAADKFSDNLKKSFGRLPLGDIDKFNKSFLSLKNNLNNVKISPLPGGFASSVATANTQLQKLPNSSNAATQSLINLSRVAQDAPFGFLGIANNLNPLLESFQRLKAESGSTGGALKSLGSSMLGAGGIGLALGVVSSLLIVFGKNLFGAGEKADESKGKLDALASSIKDVTDNVSSLSNALSFQNQLGAINIQISGTGDLQDLREQSVAQQKLVSDLGIQILKAKENLNAAILENDKQQSDDSKKVAQDAFEALQKIQNKEIDESNKGILIFRQIALQKKKNAEEDAKKEEDQRKDSLDSLKKYIDDAKRLASELEKIGFIQPQFSFFDSVEDQLVKAKKVFADFNSRNLQIDPTFFKIEPTFSEPRPEQLQEALSPVEQGIKSGIISLPPIQIPIEVSANFAANLIKNVNTDLTKAFQDIGINAPDIDFSKTPGFNFNVQIDALRKFFGASQDITKEGLEAMAADFAKGVAAINKSIASLQVEGIAGFGEALGVALTGGDISNIFQGFANTVASGVQAIGKQFIALGAVAVAAKNSLATLFTNPFAAIAAGVALVAVGAALKSAIGGGVPGFAAGGLVFGPTLGLVGEGVGTSRSNPEVIAPLDQLKGMLSDMGGGGTQRVVISGRLRGRDMALQNARTSRSQRRLGA